MKKTVRLPGAKYSLLPDYYRVLSIDKKLAAIIEKHGPVGLKKRKHIHLSLCFSIMSQQLNIKVAERLQERFLALFNKQIPTTQQIHSISIETLKAIGLSTAKAQYINNVALFFSENSDAEKQINRLANEEAIAYLTQIKGVGRWTAEMLLMFTLARPDVFPSDDYGIQQAMKKLYLLDDSDKKIFKQQILKISRRWHPYQTYACIHLWRWKDEQ
jgi:DNA-3-methyladenine glycosylase II